MTTTYTRIHKYAFFFLILFLTACGGRTGQFVPWDMPSTTGVVTNDPKSQPEIGWQTEGQRAVLSRQNAEFAKAQAEQAAAPLPEDVESRTLPPPEREYRPSLQYGEAAPAAPPPRAVKVALLVPMTGGKAKLGQAMLQAAQMALFDVGSTNFELMPRDTKSTPEGAALAAREALNARADLILGPVFSDDLKAVKAIANNSTVPVISFSTDWTQAGGNTYIMGFLPFAQVARVVDYAQRKGLNRFGVYAPQTEYSDIVISTMNRTNARIIRTGRYSPLQSDLSSVVRDFVNAGRFSQGDTNGDGKEDMTYTFDALVLPVGGESLRTVTALLDAEGLTAQSVKFLGTGLWDDADISGNASLHGGWYAAPDPTLRRDFEKRFKANYGGEPARLASLAYDATALAAVLAHSGAAQPFSREHLISPRGFAGIDGIFRFRPDGLPERGLAVLEIRPGGARVIDPAPTAFISSGS